MADFLKKLAKKVTLELIYEAVDKRTAELKEDIRDVRSEMKNIRDRLEQTNTRIEQMNTRIEQQFTALNGRFDQLYSLYGSHLEHHQR